MTTSSMGSPVRKKYFKVHFWSMKQTMHIMTETTKAPPDNKVIQSRIQGSLATCMRDGRTKTGNIRHVATKLQKQQSIVPKTCLDSQIHERRWC